MPQWRRSGTASMRKLRKEEMNEVKTIGASPLSFRPREMGLRWHLRVRQYGAQHASDRAEFEGTEREDFHAGVRWAR